MDGRRSGVELIGLLCSALPAPVLDDKAQLLFLPLVLRCANDDDSGCRKLALTSLRSLLARCSASVFFDLFAFVAGWLGITANASAGTADPTTGNNSSGGGGVAAAGEESKEAAAGAAVAGKEDDDDNNEAPLPSAGDASSSQQADNSVTSPVVVVAPSLVLLSTAAQVSGVFVEARPDLMKRQHRGGDNEEGGGGYSGGSSGSSGGGQSGSGVKMSMVGQLLVALRQLLVSNLDREQTLLAKQHAQREKQVLLQKQAEKKLEKSSAAAAEAAAWVRSAMLTPSLYDEDEDEDNDNEGDNFAGRLNDGGLTGDANAADGNNDSGSGGEHNNDGDGSTAPGWLPPWAVCYQGLIAIEKCLRVLPGASEHAMQQTYALATAASSSSSASLSISGGDGSGDEDSEDTSFQLTSPPHKLVVKKNVEEEGVDVDDDDDAHGSWFLGAVSEALVMGHPWVRLASSRLLGLYLSRRSPQRLMTNQNNNTATATASSSTTSTTEPATGAAAAAAAAEFLLSTGALFRLTRRTLTQVELWWL